MIFTNIPIEILKIIQKYKKEIEHAEKYKNNIKIIKKIDRETYLCGGVNDIIFVYNRRIVFRIKLCNSCLKIWSNYPRYIVNQRFCQC